MLTIKKINKNYSKRRLQIKEGNKIIDVLTPFFGWYSHEKNIKKYEESIIKEIRKLTIENLYWLLGRDCDFEDWNRSIEHWNKGKGVNGLSAGAPSMFFSEEEKQTALNSFYNTQIN